MTFFYISSLENAYQSFELVLELQTPKKKKINVKSQWRPFVIPLWRPEFNSIWFNSIQFNMNLTI